MRLTTTKTLCRCGELATTFIMNDTEGPFTMCGKHADEYGATFLAKARATHHAIIGPVQRGQESWLAGCGCGKWERLATSDEACRLAHGRHLELKTKG